MRIAVLLFFCLKLVGLLAQRPVITEAEMREAAQRIMRSSGLSGNVDIFGNPDVKSAVAFVRDDRRVIEFNPEFMATILDSTDSKWSAVSVLAHEIGHHLMGHTLDPGALSIGNELECDHYSGFVLFQMGASLEQSLAAMEQAGSDSGTRTHPPKNARLAAIERGWRAARVLPDPNPDSPFSTQHFSHRIRFHGDPHPYYADQTGQVYWIDAAGHALPIGTFQPTKRGDYQWRLEWEGREFLADSRNKLWTMTPYNVWRPVGEVEVL